MDDAAVWDEASCFSRRFVMDVTAEVASTGRTAHYTFKCRHSREEDGQHTLMVGMADSMPPCVVVHASEDRHGVAEMRLNCVSYDGACCEGGGALAPRGEAGTVVMVKAALKAAVLLGPPFEGAANIELTDNSYMPVLISGRDTRRLWVGDVHMLQHPPDHPTWYEARFGAEVLGGSGSKQLAALEATRQALREPMRAEVHEFMQDLEAGVKSSSLHRQWYKAARESIEATASDIGAAGGTWGQLLQRLLAEHAEPCAGAVGEKPPSHMLLVILASISRRAMCPGWTSTSGGHWRIPRETVDAYPVLVRIMES